MKKLLIAIIAGLLLSACATPPATGIVVSKHYESAHTETWVEMQCLSRDKNGMCTVSIPITQSRHHPERYVVVYRGKDSDGEMVTAEATTSPGVFDSCQAGQKWTGTECISQ